MTHDTVVLLLWVVPPGRKIRKGPGVSYPRQTTTRPLPTEGTLRVAQRPDSLGEKDFLAYSGV